MSPDTDDAMNKRKNISVVIPVYNDEPGLRTTVECLVTQDYPRTDFEVLIVDNGSEDGTYALAVQLESEYSGLVFALLENSIQSSYAARNFGIEKASGRILCFLDADVIIENDYLSRIQEFFDNNDVEYAGVNVELSIEGRGIVPIQEKIQGFPVAVYLQEMHFVPTCCLTVRRSLLDRVGWFDARLESGGDLEFGQRAFAQGAQQVYYEELTVHHPARETWGQLFKKSRRVSRGIAQLFYYLPDRYRGHFWSALLFSWWPRNPFKVRAAAKARQIEVNNLATMTIAMLRTPLGLCGVFALLEEFWKLRKQ